MSKKKSDARVSTISGKDDDDGLVIADSKAVVSQWLKPTSTTVSSASLEQDVVAPDRPHRLGVGAKFVAPTQADINAEKVSRKLGFALKKKRENEDLKRKAQESDEEDDAEMSRSQAIRSSKKVRPDPLAPALSKNAKKKLNQQAKVEQTSVTSAKQNEITIDEDGIFFSNWDDTSAAPAPANQNTKKAAVASHVLDAPKPLLTAEEEALVKDVSVENTKGEDEQPKRKRKKTRSRQKNIRKDTRPFEKKPTYLTEGAPDYIPPDKRTRKRANAPETAAPVLPETATAKNTAEAPSKKKRAKKPSKTN